MARKYNTAVISLSLLMWGIFAQAIRQPVSISIPKSGTMLMSKLIGYLTGQTSKSRTGAWPARPLELYYVSAEDFEELTHLPRHKFWWTHLFYNAEYAQRLNRPEYACFFIYRDPRDQMVSFMFYMKQLGNGWPAAMSKSYDEIIDNLIDTASLAGINPPAGGIRALYESYLPWLNEPHVLAIRFEDIVGENGGGSDEMQRKTIRDIAHHLGITLSDEALEEITKKLFGGTRTFRKGAIGSWRRYFKEEHKKKFKAVAGQLLIDLGYETDFNW